MVLTKDQKKTQLNELKQLIKESHSIIVWDYLGLKANKISELRGELLKVGSRNIVYKNRIAKRAFEESDKKEIVDILTGPSMFSFVEKDNPEALKVLKKAIDDTDELIEFKGAYIDNEWYDKKSILEIASLPSKDGLLAMLLSVLQANMRNLAYSLQQIADKEEKGKK